MKTEDINRIAEEEYPYLELIDKLKEHQEFMNLQIDGNRTAFKLGILAGLPKWVSCDNGFPPPHKDGMSKRVLCKNYYEEYHVLNYDHGEGRWYNYCRAGMIIKWMYMPDEYP